VFDMSDPVQCNLCWVTGMAIVFLGYSLIIFFVGMVVGEAYNH
jgi:Na+-transporting methylmalonyl-CoA/oxaloacetate decarboxylase gamma subunit